MAYLIIILLLFPIAAFADEEIKSIQMIDNNNYTKTVVINATFDDLDKADADDALLDTSYDRDIAIYEGKASELREAKEALKSRKLKREAERVQALSAVNLDNPGN